MEVWTAGSDGKGDQTFGRWRRAIFRTWWLIEWRKGEGQGGAGGAVCISEWMTGSRVCPSTRSFLWTRSRFRGRGVQAGCGQYERLGISR